MSTIDEMVAILGMVPQSKATEGYAEVTLLLPGLQQFRLTETPWLQYSKNVLVAGTASDLLYTLKEIKSLMQTSTKKIKVLEHQGFARHTPDQMDWAVQQLIKNPWIEHLIVSTAAYHLPRCVLTLAKSYLKAQCVRKFKFSVMPLISPVVGELFSENAEEYGKSGSVEDEIKRVDIYREHGHVATWAEFCEFRQRISHMY